MEIRPNFGGGSPGFIRGGVSFFLQGGSLIFPNRVDFTPLAPPLHAYAYSGFKVVHFTGNHMEVIPGILS